MEKIEGDKVATPIPLVGILLFLILLNWVIILQDFYSSFLCILQFYSSFLSILQFFIDLLHHAWKVCVKGKATCPEASIQKLCSDGKDMTTNGTDSSPKLFPCENVDDNKLSIGEVKMMMENYGERLGSEETAALFEEEPSPEEVKEAFNVFDMNNDGFIDAGELGKVLSTLALVEQLEVGCQRMIRVFDENGDGRIDFKEFVKLLEQSFC